VLNKDSNFKKNVAHSGRRFFLNFMDFVVRAVEVSAILMISSASSNLTQIRGKQIVIINIFASINPVIGSIHWH